TLPPANLQPVLLDPIEGRFQITLPQGLTWQSVFDWAAQTGLRLINYAPETGIAVVHPNSWRRPLAPRSIGIAYPRSTYRTPLPPAPVGPVVYVQFAPDMTTAAIAAAAQGLSLRVASISAGNLAILSVDQARVKAEIQLLSDMATVQCVSSLPNPCAQVAGGTPVTGPAPSIQQLGQPAALTEQITNGVLQLHWNVAPGATAYAIFTASSSGGPFALTALVAGQQHTTLAVFDVVPSGSTTYYEVLAVHACANASDAATCDANPIAPPSEVGARGSWTNPAPAVAPAVTAASPAPLASPVPSPPTQTVAGPKPLAPPSMVSSTAADGHVVITWAAVPGATGYRLYRSVGTNAALYIARTSGPQFTDIAGTTGST